MLEVGDRVLVFQDPITCEVLEGIGRITKILFRDSESPATLVKYRVMVQFEGEDVSYERTLFVNK